MFADRADAGRRLAEHLEHLRGERPVVGALVRGGVPVGAEIAVALDAPLEILVVRKIGAPDNPEYGIGAVGEDGHVISNPRALEMTGVDEDRFRDLARREYEEVRRRVDAYRGGRPRVPFDGRTVIVVDDGLATGVSAQTAVELAGAMGAQRVVLAVPVGPPETVDRLLRVADEVVCLATPPDFRAVGSWYTDFRQVSDDEVVRTLRAASEAEGEPRPPGAPPEA